MPEGKLTLYNQNSTTVKYSLLQANYCDDVCNWHCSRRIYC